jgi:hypothetical protein
MTPEAVVGAVGVMLVGGSFLVLWWRRKAPSPDPWSTEIDHTLQDPAALPVCHRCLEPQLEHVWFCKKCGAAVGAYNNLDPYASIFSEGEVFRSGSTGNRPPRTITIIGYVLISISMFTAFAPVYLYLLFKNLRRMKEQQRGLPPPEVESPTGAMQPPPPGENHEP